MDQVFKYAGFWMRLLAWIVDLIVIVIISSIIGFILGALGGTFNFYYTFLEGNDLFWRIFGIVVAWLYFSILECSKLQATFGKKLLRMKVTDMNAEKVSFKIATVRYFSKILSGIILGIGYLMIGFTKNKQGLHDKIAQTIVLRK